MFMKLIVIKFDCTYPNFTSWRSLLCCKMIWAFYVIFQPLQGRNVSPVWKQILKIVHCKLENTCALKPKTYLPYVSKRWRAQTTLIGLLYLQYIVSHFCWSFKRKYYLSLAQFMLCYFLRTAIIFNKCVSCQCNVFMISFCNSKTVYTPFTTDKWLTQWHYLRFFTYCYRV